MLIAVDVDLTVVNITNKWIAYLNKIYKNENLVSYDELFFACYNGTTIKPRYDYAIYKHFDMDNEKLALDFFHTEDLYDDQQPSLLSVEILKELHDQGHEILFVSYCFSGHLDSKKTFIDKFFPFRKAFIATSDKAYVKADIIIDDRISYVENNDAHTKIIMNTPFLQDQKHVDQMNFLIDNRKQIINNNEQYFCADNWIEISDILKGVM